jgi:iron-sulfur cluster assembly protein CyaY
MPHPVAAPAIDAIRSTAAMRTRRAQTAAAKSRNIERNPSTRIRDICLMTTDSEFMATTDRVLAAIGAALDAALAESDVDVDWNLNDGILEIECEDGSKLIVNRHVPNREIWVAAKSGGFHFAVRDGDWRDTRTGGLLARALADLLFSQAGLAVALPPLPVPGSTA